MSWNSSAYTALGSSMLTEALSGKRMTFTRAVGGAGTVQASELPNATEDVYKRQADAQKKLQAGIDEANHGATKLNLTVKGKLLVSGQNVEVSLGALSGKYFTDTTTHNLGSSGYTTDLELSLIE